MAGETPDFRSEILTNNPRGPLCAAALRNTGLVPLISALSSSVLSVVLIIIVLLLTLGL